MPMPISWSEIDINVGSVGYLDSTEVKNARKNGIENVFVGMIQADYENTLDVDKIISKYAKASNGRLPIYGTVEHRKIIAQSYRDLVILQCKYENLKNEFSEKYGLWDDVKFLLSKIKIVKKDRDYTNYKKNLDELELQIQLQEKLLIDIIDQSCYERFPISMKSSEPTLYVALPRIVYDN